MDMDWVKIPGFPNYSINPMGHIRNDERKTQLKPSVNQYGTLFVTLREGDVKKSVPIARMVADIFLPPHPNEPFDTPIHLDGVRSHVQVDNLLWRPRWFAIHYHRQFLPDGTFLENVLEGPIRNRNTGEVYRDSYEIVTSFGVLNQDVRFAISLGKNVFPTYLELEMVDAL